MKNIKILLSCFIVCNAYANESLFLNNLKTTLSLDDQTYATLLLQATDKETVAIVADTQNVPLFSAYPSLVSNTPYIALGSFPTPIQRLAVLENVYTIGSFFIKQDSISGGMNADGAQL